MKIADLQAREILDSRSNPTIEVTAVLEDGSQGLASIPSGASTGQHEALELRDQDPKRFNGKGVLKAVDHVNTIIRDELQNTEAEDQAAIDKKLILKDGTTNLGQLGANAILGTSLAVSKAVANAQKLPYYQYVNQLFTQIHSQPTNLSLPTPTFNVLNGGAHTDWQTTDFQEFMLVPVAANTFAEQLEQGSEMYHALKSILKDKGLAITVGDEGGFAPKLKSNEEAITLLLEAIEKVGLKPGSDVMIALDPATSELYEDGHYQLRTQNKTLTTQDMIDMWQDWVRQYPILSLEDGLAEDDWTGWQKLHQTLTDQVILVGDDLLVTNPDRIKQAIEKDACNGLLMKVNQIGTLTESLQALHLARTAGWKTVVSHRSGETEDTSIADIAVGTGADYAKMGAPARSERVAKYNRLLKIESELTS